METSKDLRHAEASAKKKRENHASPPNLAADVTLRTGPCCVLRLPPSGETPQMAVQSFISTLGRWGRAREGEGGGLIKNDAFISSMSKLSGPEVGWMID